MCSDCTYTKLGNAQLVRALNPQKRGRKFPQRPRARRAAVRPNNRWLLSSTATARLSLEQLLLEPHAVWYSE